MSDVFEDTVGTIQSFSFNLDKISKDKAIQAAKEYLNMNHYYYHENSNIWKYVLRSSCGKERVWYGRILKGADKVCVVFGFNTIKSARQCKLK